MSSGSDWLDLSVRIALTGANGPFDLSLDLATAAGSFIAVVGPSGAGKTTFLRILAGLTQPDRGRVRVGSSTWCDTVASVNVPTRRRSVGFVFQDYALFPNMTVRRNVEYALGSRARLGEARDLLQTVGLEMLENVYPDRLSGGQKQRLALIRALARRPSVLMLDEPLSALDPIMRRQLQDEVRRLHRIFGTTTFMVSHDPSEILRLADRVVRLEQGCVVFDGTPARAFGVNETGDRLRVLAEHVSGPDDSGRATVRFDGRLCHVRYKKESDVVAAGERVLLSIDEVTAHLPRERHAWDLGSRPSGQRQA